uniref:Clr5 domain-containing protein n=1 Tax=Haemonchus placei TaxID=6290 RepID=A0A158QNJ8_HAEPC
MKPRVRASKEDWQECIETMGRDGNIVEKLRDELNVDALQLVATMKSLKKSTIERQSGSGIKEEARDGPTEWSALRTQLEHLRNSFGTGISQHSSASLLSPLD